jgi:hypothetical protein
MNEMASRARKEIAERGEGERRGEVRGEGKQGTVTEEGRSGGSTEK